MAAIAGPLRPGGLAVIERPAVIAADGAQVNSSPVAIMGGEDLYAEFEYIPTNAATIAVNAALEVSLDGVNWHQVVRFKDKTATTSAGTVQVARLTSAAAGTVADLAAAALGSASAGGAVVDGPIAGFIRMVTKVGTLTGAGATVDLRARLSMAG